MPAPSKEILAFMERSEKILDFVERFKIDHDVPIPSKGELRRKQINYPFARMEIGDSFAVPISPTDSEAALNKEIRRLRHQLVAQAGGVARSVGMSAKFISFYMPDEKAVRIWRVAREVK
jgi:hypothetical protein